MIRQEEISAVLDAQADMFRKKEQGLPREALISVPAIPSFATIITGIRRCGKSYLLFVGRLDCVNYIFLAEGINGKREGEGYSHHRLYPSKSFLY